MRWSIAILTLLGLIIALLVVLPDPRGRPTDPTPAMQPPPPIGWRYTRTGWTYFEQPYRPPVVSGEPVPFPLHPGLFALVQLFFSLAALLACSTQTRDLQQINNR